MHGDVGVGGSLLFNRLYRLILDGLYLQTVPRGQPFGGPRPLLILDETLDPHLAWTIRHKQVPVVDVNVGFAELMVRDQGPELVATTLTPR